MTVQSATQTDRAREVKVLITAASMHGATGEIAAPGDGVVAEVRVKEGKQVAAGQVPAMLEAAVTETSDAS